MIKRRRIYCKRLSKGGQYYSATARETQKNQLAKISQSVSRRIATREAVGEFSGQSNTEKLVEAIDESLLGPLVVDLEGINSGDLSSNTIMGAGDRIFVPKFSNTIAVVGEVYEPGTFRFEPGASINDYLETAGGQNEFRAQNIYLLKADGSVQSSQSSYLLRLQKFNNSTTSVIEPGDAIVVPTNLNTTHRYSGLMLLPLLFFKFYKPCCISQYF